MNNSSTRKMRSHTFEKASLFYWQFFLIAYAFSAKRAQQAALALPKDKRADAGFLAVPFVFCCLLLEITRAIGLALELNFKKDEACTYDAFAWYHEVEEGGSRVLLIRPKAGLGETLVL